MNVDVIINLLIAMLQLKGQCSQFQKSNKTIVMQYSIYETALVEHFHLRYLLWETIEFLSISISINAYMQDQSLMNTDSVQVWQMTIE